VNVLVIPAARFFVGRGLGLVLALLVLGFFCFFSVLDFRSLTL